MLIREDKHGLYIRSRWWTSSERNHPAYRPGHFSGYSHAWNTTDAGLQAGDNPKTAHVNGAPFIRITLEDGTKVYWGSCGRQEGDFKEGDTVK
jgi:hypothetical protein